jgi:hypothetical protein
MSAQLNELPEVARPLLEQYLAELKTFYPVAKGRTEIIVEGDGKVFVGVPWPEDDDELIKLSEHTANIETDILVETGHDFMIVPTRELSSN